MNQLENWYLEREIDRLKEEVGYWRYNYNKAMNLFLKSTAMRVGLEKQLNRLREKYRKPRKRKRK